MKAIAKELLYPVNTRTKLIFFAGKGGVGKTTVSCATAVKLARQGLRTLLVTTDPASHLSEVFEQSIGDAPVAIKGMPNLWAARIDQKKAAEEYKEKALGDARQKGYSEDVIAVMEEQLDSPCTEEMASFNRFIDYAGEARYEVLVFDTAPTGHTIRLLELPLDWSQQLELQAGGSVAADEANRETKERYDRVIGAMRDPNTTSFAFVVYPEHTPVVEALRGSKDLKATGIKTSLVVANNVLPEAVCTTPFFAKRWEMQQDYLASLEEEFKAPVLELPLFADEIVGLEALIKAGDELYGA